MSQTSAQRQAAFRERQRAKGLVPISGWVQASQAADIALVLIILEDDPEVELAMLRNTRTGRLQKL